MDELLAYWRVEDAEATLEELEDLLIVRLFQWSSWLLCTDVSLFLTPDAIL